MLATTPTVPPVPNPSDPPAPPGVPPPPPPDIEPIPPEGPVPIPPEAPDISPPDGDPPPAGPEIIFPGPYEEPKTDYAAPGGGTDGV